MVHCFRIRTSCAVCYSYPEPDGNPGSTVYGEPNPDYFDTAGLMATPGNSSYNELVIEAARESLLGGGRMVEIAHSVDAEPVASGPDGCPRV